MDLNTTPPDLALLFQKMPGFAALQAGEQSRMAERNNQSLADAFAANEAQKAAERPWDLQQKQATVRSTNAGAGYNEALSRASNQKSDMQAKTMDSDVATHLAGNQTKLGAEHIEQAQQLGDRLRQAGMEAASLPYPWQKIAAVKRVLGDQFKQDPEFDKYLSTIPSQNLHTFLLDMGTNIMNAARPVLAEDKKLSAHQTAVETQGDTARDVARINAQGKIDAKGTAAPGADKPKTMSQYEAMLRQAASDGDADAIKALTALEADKQARAAAAAGVGDEFKRELLNMPKGTKNNGDGTFTLPDGTKIRKKK